MDFSNDRALVRKDHDRTEIPDNSLRIYGILKADTFPLTGCGMMRVRYED